MGGTLTPLGFAAELGEAHSRLAGELEHDSVPSPYWSWVRHRPSQTLLTPSALVWYARTGALLGPLAARSIGRAMGLTSREATALVQVEDACEDACRCWAAGPDTPQRPWAEALVMAGVQGDTPRRP